MIINMPVGTFLATCIWPFVYICVAIVDYFVMKKQDAQVDDSEFEEHLQMKNKKEVSDNG